MDSEVRRVVFLPRAQLDILRAYRHIAEDNPAAAETFLIAVESAVERIRALPGIGKVIDLPSRPLRGARSWNVSSFPNYAVFYLVSGQDLTTLRVLHSARDLERLEDDL